MSKKPDEPKPAATKKRRTLTPEIDAMARIDAILCNLEPVAAERVLNWINAKFDGETGPVDQSVNGAIAQAMEAGR